MKHVFTITCAIVYDADLKINFRPVFRKKTTKLLKKCSKNNQQTLEH